MHNRGIFISALRRLDPTTNESNVPVVWNVSSAAGIKTEMLKSNKAAQWR